MNVPNYKGFWFTHKASPEHSWDWTHCKENAARNLGQYARTQLFVSLGQYTIGSVDCTLRKKRTPLEKSLKRLCKEYGVSGKVEVKTIKNFPSTLRIKVPKEWLNNRITAHLLLTAIRDKVRGRVKNKKSIDQNHLERASKLVRYAKKIGLSKFNTQMKRINPSNHLKGIVAADRHMKYYSKSKIYKKA